MDTVESLKILGTDHVLAIPNIYKLVSDAVGF